MQNLTKMGLGFGLDLPWGAPVGFDLANSKPTPNIKKFINANIHDFNYASFSFQPKGTLPLESKHYRAAYLELKEYFPPDFPMALHQTLLNLGSLSPYNRDKIYEFTNQFHRDFNWSWVVEDLGIWSIKDIPLPYPLPPLFFDEACDHIISQVRAAKAKLNSSLHVEFPGFTDGVTIVLGDIDAYDYFNRIVNETQVDVTLDVGHLLSWRWWIGKRGNALFEDLHRLPLEYCRELHLSGCAIKRDRFLDLHHGVLLEEQLLLCELLLERCPNLVAVTYEDPNFDKDGNLLPVTVPSYHALKEMVSKWQQ